MVRGLRYCGRCGYRATYWSSRGEEEGDRDAGEIEPRQLGIPSVLAARRRVLLAIPIALLLAALTASPALAHGFGERYDLPVPLWLYISGAGAAVVLSFVVIGFFLRRTSGAHRYPRLNLLHRRAGRALVHPGVTVFIQEISVALFLLIVVAGLIGDPAPGLNFAPTAVWIIWWVGMAYISALIGDLWLLINPWRILFNWAGALYRHVDPEARLSLHLPYPRGLGHWPGFFLFLAFAWVEIVFPGSALPANIAYFAIIYSLVTWAGMFLFGPETWLRHGEAFSLAFGFVARFAPTEIRVTDAAICGDCELDCRDHDGHCIGCIDCFRHAAPENRELNLRPFAVGLLRHETVSTSALAFVVLFLSTVTFDGFTATPTWGEIHTLLADILPTHQGVATLGIIVFPIAFIAIFRLVAGLMGRAAGAPHPATQLARVFVYSLIPIALAYHLAHFLSFLLIQGQLIIPLASDPFGRGWDLFGTFDYDINIAIVNARFAWITAVSAIVLGHILAVYLAHVIALRTFPDHRTALRSQYPMLVLMVAYTIASLWILAQPIVEIA
ncbi:MAG: hypothetical protein QF719_02835 [Chloroflexota bacterium]|nr:hypothetical protein [Chloroflexota bacterium]MDP6757137.1 hypothetical protein [Chloroflexota bacterium]